MSNFKVGITGGIGSGKSLVSAIFQILGIPIYNADLEARKIMINDSSVKEDIISFFGNLSYLEDGSLNRDFISSQVFHNPEKLNTLNSIVHPAVGLHFANWAKCQKAKYVLKEAALLFETGSFKQLDKTILVTAPQTLREQRVLKRDPFRSKEEVLAIMEKQWSDSEKEKLCDFIINNDEKTLIIPQVLSLHQQLLLLSSDKKPD